MYVDKLISWTLKKSNQVKQLLKLDYKNSKSGHTKFYTYVINNINKKKKNFFSGEEALKSLILINSIYCSSQKKSSLKILDTKDTFLGVKKNFKNKINL